MVDTIFASWFIDHSLMVHGYLLALDVFATVVVVWGILWESDGPLNVHSIARKLVIWGVAAEAIITIAIFVFDERISSVQQSKIEVQKSQIIELAKRLAARTLSDAQLDDMKRKLGRFITAPEQRYGKNAAAIL
jgi:hypothetical protein